MILKIYLKMLFQMKAKDILAVLENEHTAPVDLKEKALTLASTLMEFSGEVPVGMGLELARHHLETGAALRKFIAICNAQGGFKRPASAPLTVDICATSGGIVTVINNRNLAKVAKLAGAPHDPTAGIEFFSRIGTDIKAGQVLYRIHAESKGALDYSRAYALSMPDIIQLI